MPTLPTNVNASIQRRAAIITAELFTASFLCLLAAVLFEVALSP